MSVYNVNQLIRRNTFYLPRQLTAAMQQGGKKWELILSIREFGSASMPGPRQDIIGQNRQNSKVNRTKRLGNGSFNPPKKKQGKRVQNNKKNNQQPRQKSNNGDSAKQNTNSKPEFRGRSRTRSVAPKRRSGSRSSGSQRPASLPPVRSKKTRDQPKTGQKVEDLTAMQHLQAALGANNNQFVRVDNAPQGVIQKVHITKESTNSNSKQKLEGKSSRGGMRFVVKR